MRLLALFLTDLHESNHWIRRYQQQGKCLEVVLTQERDQPIEKKSKHGGGEILFYHLFGKTKLINLYLYMSLFSLNENKWKCKYSEFKKNYCSFKDLIKNNNTNKKIEFNSEEKCFLDSLGLNLKDIFKPENLVKCSKYFDVGETRISATMGICGLSYRSYKK